MLALAATFAPAASSWAAEAPASETQTPCKKRGPQYSYIEAIDACMKYDVSAFAFGGMDFAQNDIEMQGDRIFLPLVGTQLPLLTYSKKDVSDDTEYPKLGGGITADVTVVRETKGGPLVGFFSAGLYSDGDLSGSEDVFDDVNVYTDGTMNFYPGVIQQAWLRYQGVQAGVQQSKFDFISAGYNAFPGYSSRARTLAVNATKNFGDTSLSLSFEDSSVRDMDDGVIANYEESFMVDPVLQFRGRHKNALFHASGAIHRITFDGEDFGMDDEDSWGAAGQAGAMFEFRSKGDPKVKGDEELSRLMMSVSVAQGALGYLGMPDFAVDYTVNGDGNMDLSRGASGLVSYMHMLDERTKLALTASGFWSKMTIDETQLVERSEIAFAIGQEVEVTGAKVQAGIERVVRPDLLVGAEASYTWTTATGFVTTAYDDYDMDTLTVNFPEVRAYLSWKIK